MMDMALPVIAGNWKMHHGPADARAFVDAFLPQIPENFAGTIALFPPALSLAAVRDVRSERLCLGVQNIHHEPRGAFTGELSAGMAREAGARLVLIGHSERRHVFGETDEATRLKVEAALGANLLPVLCVGETLEEREEGRAAEVVERQLDAALRTARFGRNDSLIIAYEPVWAIGTGKTAAPEDAEEMHGTVRRWLSGLFEDEQVGRVPILYGGSVKPENAAALLASADVDGLLVGGASLDAESFAAICAAARTGTAESRNG